MAELLHVHVTVLSMNWREAVQLAMMRRMAGPMLQHAKVVCVCMYVRACMRVLCVCLGRVLSKSLTNKPIELHQM